MDLIDSDVFVIDLRYPRDPKYKVNRLFLDKHDSPRVTTIFNVLEVCGVMSFNLSEATLLTLYAEFDLRYSLTILNPVVEGRTAKGLLADLTSGIFRKIATKMACEDAQVLWVAEMHPEVLTFISWNARHFVGKTRLKVMTPEEWLVGSGYPVSS